MVIHFAWWFATVQKSEILLGLVLSCLGLEGKKLQDFKDLQFFLFYLILYSIKISHKISQGDLRKSKVLKVKDICPSYYSGQR